MGGPGTLVGVDAPERNDVELLAAIAAGDRRALETLYRRHAPWLLTRLHQRCRDTEIVDSALQDTFVSAWRSAARYRPAESVSEPVSEPVSEFVPEFVSQFVPEPEPLPPPGTPAHALLSRLPADLHPVVRAVYLEGLTTAEAAVLLGIPQGTVKSRLSRARPLLKEELR